MRLTLWIILVCSAVNLAVLAAPPAPQKVDKAEAVLKAMEGQWTLVSGTAATPECIITSVFDNPTVTKPGVRVTKGVLELTMKDEAVPGGRNKIDVGADPACLLLTPVVEEGQKAKPFKCRVKIEGDTMTLVQDHSRPDEYPESFDPKKGRDRGRAVTVFTREKDKR